MKELLNYGFLSWVQFSMIGVVLIAYIIDIEPIPFI